MCESVFLFCFDVAFTDPNPGDTIIYDAILSNLALAYPGATINTTGMSPITVSICWTPTNLGYYYGTAFANDNYCPLQGVGSFTSIIQVTTCSPVGIDEQSATSVNIHPNPTTGKLIISIAGQTASSVTLRNSLGQVLLSGNISSTNQIELDLSSYPAGIYFLQLEVNGQVITKQVLKE